MPILKGALVVSCQARADNPLHGPVHMAAMARAAEAGGASGIRANGAEDVVAIRAATALPIIGISKVWDDRFPVYITPGFDDAAQIAAAGADIIGLDATGRPRNGEPVERLIARIRTELGREVFADIATLEEGRAAHAHGATYVASTLSGYTEETTARKGEGPDLELLEALVAALPVPVVAEGRFDTPELVAEAFRRGAHAVVVGTAITNPREITKKFVRAAQAWTA
ncbi:N-acetylmannosamine-6-phosphate 2-epimerase [Microvirga makkahensis]|uniref:Putative N-acetylmannosamine-6-phosphate 2-epimerase n=1 Tax=Microvirga makkahensis TaxID=1128670 RepID=A0A7X3MNK2_9HYPH|nr:putative N-acetylmannosamine-6-phosphate 2-epimerase [Microvirga makkahensis]MXQ10183.1 putative N-acetylmannosamine-6-phosphate 2-epimerase [Microvirga makkahensis]